MLKTVVELSNEEWDVSGLHHSVSQLNNLLDSLDFDDSMNKQKVILEIPTEK